jgi:thymidylate synthase
MSYRARIWHHKRKKYNFISLNAKNELDATHEALETYAQLTSAIEKNLPISADARKLEHYIGMFMDYMDVRSKNKKITPKRVVVVRQLLRSLEKFYDEQSSPTITELSKLYEEQYEQWRDQNGYQTDKQTTLTSQQKQRIQLPSSVLWILKGQRDRQ